MNTPPLAISLNRNAHFFVARPGLAERLEKIRHLVYLAPDQLLHPDGEAEYIVRLGKLRVSEFLDNGQEITRAVLQAGGVLIVTARHVQRVPRVVRTLHVCLAPRLLRQLPQQRGDLRGRGAGGCSGGRRRCGRRGRRRAGSAGVMEDAVNDLKSKSWWRGRGTVWAQPTHG